MADAKKTAAAQGGAAAEQGTAPHPGPATQMSPSAQQQMLEGDPSGRLIASHGTVPDAAMELSEEAAKAAGLQRVLLERPFLAPSGRLYERSAMGTWVPKDLELPKGTKVWDGEKFVEPKAEGEES